MVAPFPPGPARLARRARRFAADPRTPDLLAGAALLGATAVAAGPLVVGGTTIGQDTGAFFYPIFSALGERLAAGDVPGWNPHQFAGVPFAADPESGWMYLPAMLFFALLPITAAATAWIIFHLLLAGFGAYALGRAVGIGPLGAVTAAIGVEFSGLLFARTVCCPAYSQVAAWLPLLLLATERSIAAQDRTGRVGWWCVGGLALGQIFVAWLGQGSYYALLAFGWYVLGRTLLGPGEGAPRLAVRLRVLPFHLGVPVAAGLALSAAAILPRLEYHARTNLAEGYTDELSWAAVLGGWTLESTVGQLLHPSFYYAGGGLLALALVALLLVRNRHAAPIFALLTVGTVVLAQRETTWLHVPLYRLLPRFDELHRHWPERDMVAFAIGPAMLAGAAVHTLGRWRAPSWTLGPLALFPILATLAIDAGLGGVAPVPLRAVFGISAGLLLALRSRGWVRHLARVALVLIVFVDLLAVGRYNQNHGLYGGFHAVDLDRYYAPSAATAFLRSREDVDGEPARFFGYDPAIHDPETNPPLYRHAFADPRTQALMLNNRATLLGLQDVQGYNPLQPQRYVDAMRVINGFTQEYHEANVYPEGLDSPLLDLLNVRYVVVPAAAEPDRPDLDRLKDRLPTVYADDDVAILENRAALPRAWIVHDARRTSSTGALAELAAGRVDPRAVALVEEAPPPLAPAADAAADVAAVTAYEADRFRVRTRTDAPGLLVLSEMADPDWRATVDGSAAPILVANGLLRAVPIPRGDHVVELRYDSPRLKLGTAISVAAYALIVAAWGVNALRLRRPGRPRRRPAGGPSSATPRSTSAR